MWPLKIPLTPDVPATATQTQLLWTTVTGLIPSSLWYYLAFWPQFSRCNGT